MKSDGGKIRPGKTCQSSAIIPGISTRWWKRRTNAKWLELLSNKRENDKHTNEQISRGARMQYDTTEEYRTANLDLSAYLIASGISDLVGLELQPNRRHVLFVLSPAPGEVVKANYFDGSATVSAFRFAEVQARLKQSIHEQRQHVES